MGYFRCFCVVCGCLNTFVHQNEKGCFRKNSKNMHLQIHLAIIQPLHTALASWQTSFRKKNHVDCYKVFADVQTFSFYGHGVVLVGK